MSLPRSSEELATDLCLSRAWKKLGHYCDPQGPFGISTMICWYTHSTQSTTEGSRETVNCTAREKKIPHEALMYCGQWVSSTEARKAIANNFPGFAARQRYFTALFVFSFLKQAGLGSLISVTYGACTTLPVCVGINTLNTLTAVMCSFQGKIPGGHETEMGRLWRNMVYRELPSQCYGKAPLLHLRAGMAQVFLLGCITELSKLQCYCAFKHISKDNHHFSSSYHGCALHF